MTEVLKAHGVKTKGFVAYGDPAGDPTSDQWYAANGFTFYPRQDGSNGYEASTLADIAQYMWLITYSYGFGYETQFYPNNNNVLAVAPQDQEFYLSGGVLSPALAFPGSGNYPGLVIDSPYLIQWFSDLTNQVVAGVGFERVIGGPADWVTSDHSVNYAGAQGRDGGHNMNTYARYVNNYYGFSTNFYRGDISTAGTHNTDGSPCLLFPLVGQQPNYTAANCEPSVAMATDVSKYHHSNGQSSSFAQYCGTANANLEYEGIQKPLQAYGKVFSRTSMPANLIANIPAYASCVFETMTQAVSAAFGVLMSTGQDLTCTPFFNWAQPGDDSSNPGGGYSVATQATVLSFCLGVVPYFSTYDMLEADSDYASALQQVTATTMTEYTKLWNQIPLGGWYGTDLNAVNVLVIDHFYTNQETWSALGLMCHPWGTDSYLSLSGWNLSRFNVILGIPNGQDPTYAADLAQVESYVSNGGTVIVQNNTGAPANLTGIGTTAAPIPYGHPITEPYVKADLDAALPNGYGYINQYGKGQVITLNAYGYGDGFSLGDASNGTGGSDSLASGLAYLTFNAILWASGQPWAIALPKYVQRTSWAAPLNYNGQGGSSGVGIHAIGYPLQCILLSTGSAATPVAFDLNPAFYGISGSAVFQDANTGATSGPNFTPTIPAQGWMAFNTTGAQTQPVTSNSVVILVVT
jgi:hypothetical protein